jgi:hypothetical protein
VNGDGSEAPDTTKTVSLADAGGQSATAVRFHSGTESEPAPGADRAESRHPGSLPAETWARVQAINANCLAKLRGGTPRRQAICVALQECYDVLIEDGKAQGSLTENSLTITTPRKLLHLAVEVGWLGISILDESGPELRDPAQPPRPYRVEPAYRTWLWGLLEPRAEYWRARRNAEPFGLELPKPQFVIHRLPATTAEGLLLQAHVSLEKRMAREPRQFHARRLREILKTAGVPPEEIIPRRMLLTATESVGNPAIPIALIPDPSRAAAEGEDPESIAGSLVTDPVASERNELLRSYKASGRKQSIVITDKMVAHAANSNWNDRTMITQWKRNDIRCKSPHDRMIRAVFRKDPSSLWDPKPRARRKRI